MIARFGFFIVAAGLGLNCSTLLANTLSCHHQSADLSCEEQGIDCYRFDYATINSFKQSVTHYAERWQLSSPSPALSKLIDNETFQPTIDSIDNVVLWIESDPEQIYAFGRYVEREQKPREWLFVAEQAFIRSWNNVLR